MSQGTPRLVSTTAPAAKASIANLTLREWSAALDTRPVPSFTS